MSMNHRTPKWLKGVTILFIRPPSRRYRRRKGRKAP